MTETDQIPFPAGARIEVRGAEWLVRSCVRTAHAGYKIKVTGVSELVRDEAAVFFSELERPRPVLLKPEETELRPDETPGFTLSRLYLEATLRRTPLPQSERRIATRDDSFLLDPHTYQLRPAEQALKNLWPNILIADVVGLGKTLEIGLLLAELIRRGCGDRILVVTPQQVLDQFQMELWTRFAIPLIRLDSIGIDRIQRDIPAGRNPFTYYKRIIVSIDTLKNEGRYGHHLDSMDWDVVVIDESHNLIGSGSRNLRRKLAQRLARKTDALVLASATPHNGDAESFAELIRMLDPAAIADTRNYRTDDIQHLYIRRTKVSPEVTDELKGEWPPRGPSNPRRCPASEEEEKVFAELAKTWFSDANPATGKGADRHLFPYTLLKAFLSSHKALAETAGNRAGKSTDDSEKQALARLKTLADAIEDKDSAKLKALVAKLKKIGVGPDSDTRAVVFCESIPTLNWLSEVLPTEIGLTEKGQVETMHGMLLSDRQQHETVERFSLKDAPVRVLLTGDVASEGVNMHKQCHHMIHYDLPWSLIRIEQRNGRIDRYGQQHEPEFTALILTSKTPDAKDDTTVAEKLLAREDQAHRTLGTAEGVTRQFDADKEEDRLTRDLLEGKTVDESLDAADKAEDDTLDFLAGLLEGTVETDTSQLEKAEVPRLFESTEKFARAALESAVPDLNPDDDGQLIAFTPPGDLAHRLSVLPPSYLKKRDVYTRMRVTFDRDLAFRKLKEAQQSKETLWPEIAYLSDLHPMIEWLTDKVLLRVPRQQAPVFIANVAEPVFLIQGVYSNALGRPTVVKWMAVTGLPHDVAITPMTEALEHAKVGPGMVNTLQFGDLAALQDLVPHAVAVARKHLEESREIYDAQVNLPIEEYRSKLARWEQLSLEGLAPQVRTRREDDVRETAEGLRHLTDILRTTGEPLLRILAVMDGDR